MGIVVLLTIFLAASALPLLIVWTYTGRLLRENDLKKKSILRSLGVPDDSKRTLVGFFHPYWYVRQLTLMEKYISDST